MVDNQVVFGGPLLIGINIMDKLTEGQVDAIYSLIIDFRYEYEGPRNTDDIEVWVDKWVKDRQ